MSDIRDKRSAFIVRHDCHLPATSRDFHVARDKGRECRMDLRTTAIVSRVVCDRHRLCLVGSIEHRSGVSYESAGDRPSVPNNARV